jgi:putative resolvase
LQKLFDIVEKRQADVAVVGFKDRLTRFGFNYLKRYFESHGVRVEVVEESEKGYVEELIEDFVSIVTSFAARIAEVQEDKKGRRGGGKQYQLKLSRRRSS